LLDQKVYKHNSDKVKNHKRVPITEKESYRWLESLKKTQELCGAKTVVTICDRESDIYEFFVEANKIGARILVRASKDRIVFGQKHTNHDTLWPYMQKQNIAAYLTIDVPAQKNKPMRNARLELRYGEVQFNPPQRMPSAQIGKLSKIRLGVIWLYEKSESNDRLEWMLLTNISINNTEDALKIGQWYKLRWLIECFHRVLKSGCQVENCRLETFDRLKRYLALKSIIAYRLYYLTMVGRANPNISCETVFAKHEWIALHCYVNKTSKPPSKPPAVHDAIRLLAKLGGFPGRKNDGEPGMTTIWRGWNKLTELSKMWLVLSGETYG
jgi:hypothetical protein